MKGKSKRPITCRGGFFYADKIQQAKEIGSFAVVVDPIISKGGHCLKLYNHEVPFFNHHFSAWRHSFNGFCKGF
jgi:hypothetical protein